MPVQLGLSAALGLLLQLCSLAGLVGLFQPAKLPCLLLHGLPF
jgi:hypothetical protein